MRCGCWLFILANYLGLARAQRQADAATGRCKVAVARLDGNLYEKCPPQLLDFGAQRFAYDVVDGKERIVPRPPARSSQLQGASR